MIGQSLAHYEILAELGRGGMGVVYKARDTRLGRLVALKLLPDGLAEDARRIDLLRREAQAAAALNHPRIVTVYSVEEAGGRLFLTMEYVEGKTLDRAIPRGGFSLERFFKIAIPLADAVSTAHDQGIVHRDLKPGNIILSKDDRPKILDFGLARLRPEEPPIGATADTQAATQLETLEGKLAGTVPYMSPEQLNRRPIDHRTDIFSLGVIYFEMATGRHPFGSRPGSVASSILEDEPDSVADVRSGLPRQLGRIIRRCLQKEADSRIQSAKDLRNELEDLSLELAQPAVGTVRGARSPLRRWALPAALVATVVAAGALLMRERLAVDGAPERAVHLTVEESRIFPGDHGPDYFRQGVISSLRRRARGLSGVYLAHGEWHPVPDYVVETDVRRSGDSFSLSYRLQAREEEGGPAAAVHHAAVEALFPLVDTVWREIGRSLRSRVDRPVRYRQAGIPTADATAFDLFLRAEAALATGGEAARQEALTLLEEALARDRRFGLALAASGRIRLLQHRDHADPELPGRAETACREAAALDSALADAHGCLGDALLAQGRALEAAEAYRRAIRLDPSDLRPHSGLRLAYLDLGLPESLEASWKELIRFHPDHWAGYASLAGFYLDQDRYEPALAQYLEAIERAPSHARLHFMLGSVYYLLGRYEDATQSNQRSMAIRPNWYATYNLGSLHYIFRRFDEAVAAYEQAVAFRPDHYASHGRLGWACYWAPGRREEAAAHLARAIELTRAELERTPEDADLHVMLAVFEAIHGDRDRSLEALNRALYYQPNSGHHLFLAAVAQAHRGDLEAAIDYLQQAVAQGYPIAEIRHLTDLDPLREDPRFRALL